eukprot:TRINITY_DN2738_c0_g1_i1.p1 TRINITY_DN2738_c0_g1~~TRINITY_DN2738_c0_g1_i1.p1  ORF type:complete len:198 (-),score=48.23 TRINITY_DN2738_c0_g1_i1:78-671(-)
MWARIKNFLNIDMLKEAWQIARATRQANQFLKKAAEEHMKEGQKTIQLAEEVLEKGKAKLEHMDKSAKKMVDDTQNMQDFMGGFKEVAQDPTFQELKKTVSGAKGAQDVLSNLKASGLGITDLLNPKALSPEKQKAAMDVMMKNMQQNSDILSKLKLEDVQKMQQMMSKIPGFGKMAQGEITAQHLDTLKEMAKGKK